MKRFWIFVLAIYTVCTPSFAEPANPKAYLQMLYENKGGYIIPPEDVETILQAGGHPQYGEIPYDSAAHILNDLALSRQDVFYDLGSGVGKLAIQVYLTTPVKRSIGVELSKSRWSTAESCRQHVAKDDHITSNRELAFLHQNILNTYIADATICFINGITFPPALMKSMMDRLGELDDEVKVISVLPLPAHKQFHLIKTYQLPMSWAPEGVDVCLYSVTPTSQSDTKPSSKRKKRGKRKTQKNKPTNDE